MNSFDLDITSVSVPSDIEASAGRQALHEVATLQATPDDAPRRLGLRRLLAFIRDCLANDARTTPFTMSGPGRPSITIG